MFFSGCSGSIPLIGGSHTAKTGLNAPESPALKDRSGEDSGLVFHNLEHQSKLDINANVSSDNILR